MLLVCLLLRQTHGGLETGSVPTSRFPPNSLLPSRIDKISTGGDPAANHRKLQYFATKLQGMVECVGSCEKNGGKPQNTERAHYCVGAEVGTNIAE
jgi:hypothetical protein